MNSRQTVSKSQIEDAESILRILKDEISADFIGLVSTSGVSLIALKSSGETDTDALASLSAGSFAATRQLARMMDETDFNAIFYEGSELNIQIVEVNDETLLVICFRSDAEMGKVRLISRRAISALMVALAEKPFTAETGIAADDVQETQNIAVKKTGDGGRASGTN
ncbi:MAG: roadblock/LC7 domain-containing protein [Thermoleophilia bacterium]